MTVLLTNGIINIDTYQYSNNNWKDQLSNYNGESIIYDGLGNLIKIRHKNNQYRANLYFDPVIKNVSKEQARGLEQELIIECGTLIPDKINPVHNQINGVSLSNINYQFYWDLAITYLDENVVLCNDPSRIK